MREAGVTRRGDGGVQPRARARPGGGHPLRGRRVHQPLAGPPGLPRRHGRATSRPRPRCSTGAPSTRWSASTTIWGARLAARVPAAVTVATTGASRRLARRRRRHRRRRRPALHRAHPGRPGAGAAAAARAVQRGQRAGRARLPGRGRRARRAVAAERFAEVAVPGRMQRIDVGQPFLAVVDYAHKPAAVAALLDTLRAQVPGRLIIVLGCGGDRDRGKRPLMGAAAARAGRRCSSSPTTTRAPRTRPPSAPRCWPVPAPSPAAARCARSATGARRSPRRSTRPGPATPSSSRARGTRPGRRSAGVRHPFDDAAELAAAIRGVITGVLGAARR